MLLQIKDYHKANEILYILKSIDDAAQIPVSKIALQKLLYLSGVLAPIKDIILSFVKFQRIQRGPYSKDIQNIVDHLVAYDLVEIIDFKIVHSKNSTAYYKITSGGISAVNNLISYSKEDEKFWWISCVTKLATIYSNIDFAENDTEFTGIDKVVRLVYQDYTFKETLDNKKFRALIDFEDTEGPTVELISFIKSYAEKNKDMIGLGSERSQAELILIAFMDQLYHNYYQQFTS